MEECNHRLKTAAATNLFYTFVFIIFMLLPLLLTDTLTFARSREVQCNDTLGPGGKFKLKEDLICVEGDLLTLRDGAELDLNGYTLEGTSLVLLTGRKAEIRNGTIRGRDNCINMVCVLLEGEGGHVVENVNILAPSDNFGIEVSSDNNRLIGNTSFGEIGFFVVGRNNVLLGNFGTGFFVGGTHHKVIGNSSTASIEGLFEIRGTNHLLMHNFSAGVGDGFVVYGDNNRLFRNMTTRRIQVIGQNNVLEENLSFGGSPDLSDHNPNCDNNTWRNNFFTRSQMFTSTGDPVDNPECIQ